MSGEILAYNQYRYDGNENRAGKNQLHGETSYTYDRLNRLTRVQYPGSFEELTYDRARNRTGRISPKGEEFYQYDNRNRLISRTINGMEVLNQYEYDAWGNVTKSQEKVEKRFQFNGQQYDSVS